MVNENESGNGNNNANHTDNDNDEDNDNDNNYVNDTDNVIDSERTDRNLSLGRMEL